MSRRACILALSLASCLGACRGCSDEGVPAPRASKLDAVERKRMQVLERVAARKIDPSKKKAPDAAGVTQCGTDRDCFVLAAESCNRAVLDHAQVVAIFGVEQVVAARYTIVGDDEGGCEMERTVSALELKMSPELIAALRSKGKTDEDIEKMKGEGREQLEERNPKRLVCHFKGDEMLEVALDLAEGRYDPQRWRTSCDAAAEAPPNAEPLAAPAGSTKPAPAPAAAAKPALAPAEPATP